jgi:diguanylate cyclase (GGDEF)-like protein/PAS domain S-box-containing protein
MFNRNVIDDTERPRMASNNSYIKPRKRLGAGQLASLSLLFVLVALPGFAVWGALTTYRTGLELGRAIELSDAFEAARYAVGAEESLERKYRLEPGTEIRNRHLAASAAMISSLLHAKALGGLEEAALLTEVTGLHRDYLLSIDRMFDAVDAGNTSHANEIDEHEVDPSFDAIESRVVAAADQHRVSAARHLVALADIQWNILVATPIIFAAGLALVLSCWRTIARLRQQAQESLSREASSTRLSEQRFRGLVQNAADMILLCSQTGAITYQSPASTHRWNYEPAELLETPIMALIHPEDRPVMKEFWEQLQLHDQQLEGSIRITEMRILDRAGISRSAELTAISLLSDPAIRGIVLTIRDISERKTFEQQLTQQAFYDALTGLPNRVLFRDRLQQALVRAARRQEVVGLLFLDLDNFKLVNDSLGHHVGDKLLVAAAARLRSCIRAQDTVARLGGDEFVVVLEALASTADVLPVAKAITKQFGSPFLLEGREVVVTTSIGIAVSDAGLEHAESLLRDADVAMYRAKADGRARYVIFDPSMNIDTLARLELQNDLRRALHDNEMRVFYQPIVLMGSGQMTEVEALVRWEHPTRGLVPPVEFIPAAEETGLIIPLGQWVLEQACRQVALWHAQYPSHPPMTLSVNLSPRQFQQETLVEDVVRALQETGFPATSLKLEITEGVIMRDVETTIQTLWALKNLGIQIAIDDFGTGYSSLSYLKRLPLDVLKIDRSFINGIGCNAEDTAIVHAIMALARSLNLQVTGEGIETAEQAALLNAWGCDKGQGYHFGRPLDAEMTDTLLGSGLNPQQTLTARSSTAGEVKTASSA